MIKAIVFDFDGTLMTANKVGKKIFLDLLKKEKLEFNKEKFEEFAGQNMKDKLIFIYGDEHGSKLFNEWFNEFKIEFLKEVHPFDGAIEIIKYLKSKKMKIFIFSTKYSSLIKQALKKFNIEKDIDYIIGREDVIDPKPSPEGLFILLNKFSIKKEEVIYVGDMKTDQDSAKNANIKFIYFESNYSKPDVLSYYKKINDLSELKEIIEDLNKNN